MRTVREVCQHLIEMLLEIKIEHMEMSNEETIEIDHDSHGIRLDVYVKDTGQIFDVEMQTTDTKDLPERSRYYQGLMDICLEDGKTKLNDRAYKHFFIAKNCARMIENKEVRAFFDFLTTNKSADSFTSDLHSYVTNAKHNMQWRFQYMTWERQRTYDFDAGKEAASIASAKNFLRMNLGTPEQIAQGTGLPLEQVLALKEELIREQVAVSD